MTKMTRFIREQKKLGTMVLIVTVMELMITTKMEMVIQ